MWIHREPRTREFSWCFGGDFYLQTWLDLLQNEGGLVCHKSFYPFPILGDSSYKWVSSIFSFLPCQFFLLNVRSYVFQVAYNILNISTRFLFSKSTKPTLLLFLYVCLFSILQFCDFLQLHELQHSRLFCPSLLPRVSSNSCPLSPLHYLNISPSAVPLSFWLQSFPASVPPPSRPVSQFFMQLQQSDSRFQLIIEKHLMAKTVLVGNQVIDYSD